MALILRWIATIIIVLFCWALVVNAGTIIEAFRAHWRSLLLTIVVLWLARELLQRWGRNLLVPLFRFINRFVAWHRLPAMLGALNLDAFRLLLRRDNLSDVPKGELPAPEWTPEVLVERSADGSFNDLDYPDMGKAGMRFGRNFPLDSIVRDADINLLEPNPREISRQLLARDSFKPATILNLLAAAWIQFMVHGWVNHRRNSEAFHEVPLDPADDWHEHPMRIDKSLPDSPEDTTTPNTYANTESHWWDASQIYGSNRDRQLAVRSLSGGKLKVEFNESLQEWRLPANDGEGLENIDQTGFFDNYWVGLSLFHTAFTLEHNAICDRLQAENPSWGDERLFQVARLINAALMAKIHTVEWTPAILAHPTLEVSMNANWWGLFGQRIKAMIGRVGDSEELSGIIGSPPEHHAASYTLTEEFTSVYRLHALIPDTIDLLSASQPEHPADTFSFTELQGQHTRPAMADRGLADIIYSFAVAHPGAVTLRNYPDTLRQFTRMDGKTTLDLAAIDILRDRERGIPRYNEFRRLCHMPPITRFQDLCSDSQMAALIEKVYGGNLEQVDLMVGLYAEAPPRGFGFSDTAFRIFVLMASRRLKSDRFFTRDYTADVYTQTGLDWVENNNMSSVFLRHYPQLAPALKDVNNAFAPWMPLEKP